MASKTKSPARQQQCETYGKKIIQHTDVGSHIPSAKPKGSNVRIIPSQLVASALTPILDGHCSQRTSIPGSIAIIKIAVNGYLPG